MAQIFESIGGSGCGEIHAYIVFALNSDPTSRNQDNGLFFTGVSLKGNDEFIFSYQMISEHVRARSESLQDHQTTAVPCNYNVT